MTSSAAYRVAPHLAQCGHRALCVSLVSPLSCYHASGIVRSTPPAWCQSAGPAPRSRSNSVRGSTYYQYPAYTQNGVRSRCIFLYIFTRRLTLPHEVGAEDDDGSCKAVYDPADESGTITVTLRKASHVPRMASVRWCRKKEACKQQTVIFLLENAPRQVVISVVEG